MKSKIVREAFERLREDGKKGVKCKIMKNERLKWNHREMEKMNNE